MRLFRVLIGQSEIIPISMFSVFADVIAYKGKELDAFLY